MGDAVRIEYIRPGRAERIGAKRSRAYSSAQDAAHVLADYVARLALDHGGTWRTLAAAYRPVDLTLAMDKYGASIMTDAVGGLWIVSRDSWWEQHRDDLPFALRELVRMAAVGTWDPAEPVEYLIAGLPWPGTTRGKQLSLFDDGAAA